MSWLAMSRHVTSRHVTSRHVTSRHVTSQVKSHSTSHVTWRAIKSHRTSHLTWLAAWLDVPHTITAHFSSMHQPPFWVAKWDQFDNSCCDELSKKCRRTSMCWQKISAYWVFLLTLVYVCEYTVRKVWTCARIFAVCFFMVYSQIVFLSFGVGCVGIQLVSQGTCCWRGVLFLRNGKIVVLLCVSSILTGSWSVSECVCIHTHTHTYTAWVLLGCEPKCRNGTPREPWKNPDLLKL